MSGSEGEGKQEGVGLRESMLGPADRRKRLRATDRLAPRMAEAGVMEHEGDDGDEDEASSWVLRRIDGFQACLGGETETESSAEERADEESEEERTKEGSGGEQESGMASRVEPEGMRSRMASIHSSLSVAFSARKRKVRLASFTWKANMTLSFSTGV